MQKYGKIKCMDIVWMVEIQVAFSAKYLPLDKLLFGDSVLFDK